MAADFELDPSVRIPTCPFAKALSEKGKPDMPQAIAHRGYKARYPENTMAAFKGAVDVGAHAIETDIHLTADGVVVLSHDATLARCFGKPEKIIDSDWSYISTLQTLAEPHQPMPRLKDLLEYIAQPGLDDVWILLDIKLDNESDKVMRLIAETISGVEASAARPWRERIVLGCWAAKYVPLAQKYLPGFPFSYIGFSIPYARQFFSIPNVSFNMLCPILQAPGGPAFIRQAHDRERQVFAWTVNTEDKMDWCIRRKLDGVVTDDPKMFLDYCDGFDESTPEDWMSAKVFLDSIRIWLFAVVFSCFYRNKLDRAEPMKIPQSMRLK